MVEELFGRWHPVGGGQLSGSVTSDFPQESVLGQTCNIFVKDIDKGIEVCFQGGPWEDDLHHDVHQRELTPVPASSFCVPTALQTHHIS